MKTQSNFLKRISLPLFAMTVMLLVSGIFGKINAQQPTTLPPSTIILDDFSAYNNNGAVYLSWTLKAGNTCSGIQIYRAEDGINFNLAGEIGGICGSVSSAQSYSFTDYNPNKNKLNYYKLGIGTEGYSQILSIEIIDIAQGQFLVRPNPTQAQTTIFFNNDNDLPHTLHLYGMTGAVSPVSISTNKDYFEFDASSLPAGNYWFIIKNENMQIVANSRLIVH